MQISPRPPPESVNLSSKFSRCGGASKNISRPGLYREQENGGIFIMRKHFCTVRCICKIWQRPQLLGSLRLFTRFVYSRVYWLDINDRSKANNIFLSSQAFQISNLPATGRELRDETRRRQNKCFFMSKIFPCYMRLAGLTYLVKFAFEFLIKFRR